MGDARELGALGAAKLHFVELKNIFPGLILNVRFAVLRLVDWNASRNLILKRDVSCSDFLVDHEVLHAEDDLEV